MKKNSTIFVLLLISAYSYAQNLSMKQIESDLMKQYSKIINSQLKTESKDSNSIEHNNKIFNEKIKTYTSNYPLTLDYKFDSLNQKIEILTSDDNLFRIYSWDTGMGGTMRDYENLFQFKTGGKVYSKLVFNTVKSIEEKIIPYYSRIYTVKNNNRTYYLTLSHTVYSSSVYGETVRFFRIENNALNDSVKLIKTESGLSNEIEISLDFDSFIKRHLWIKYKPRIKTLYIPIVVENEKSKSRYRKYKFNGEYFEEQLNANR